MVSFYRNDAFIKAVIEMNNIILKCLPTNYDIVALKISRDISYFLAFFFFAIIEDVSLK